MVFSKKFLTVGSLLRDPKLLEYRKQIEVRDDITYPFYDDFDGYKEAEDAAVAKVIKKQVEAGLSEISDGEQSRSFWHLDFVWGLTGIERQIAQSGYHFNNEDGSDYETRHDVGLKVIGPLSGKNHPFIDHFKRAKALAPETVKVKHNIVTPGHIYIELLFSGAIADSPYHETEEDFQADLVKAYKEFVKEYTEAGATILQMDDCIWQAFADGNGDLSIPEEQREPLAKVLTDLNNEVIAYAKSFGLRVYAHNCRGNYASRSSSVGTYEEVAQYFLSTQNYDRFYLEWDDERAGSVDVLRVFEERPDVEVVLGALSSKTDKLDDEERALKLLEKAAQYIDKDRLYLSHQCGFASCDIGNNVGEGNQWGKIQQGHEIAYKFFGE